MFFIHGTPTMSTMSTLTPSHACIAGGSYYVGAGGVEVYDGSILANRTNTVVVTINYRLGVLGFLYADGITGQYGFPPFNFLFFPVCHPSLGVLDQRLALQWVQANIASFGGDPARVTIFGQSAGANSVAFHLISSESWALFNGAILQSNPASSIYPNITRVF